MFSVGEDSSLMLTNLENYNILVIKNMDKMVTALKLSPRGNQLALGFSDGEV